MSMSKTSKKSSGSSARLRTGDFPTSLLKKGSKIFALIAHWNECRFKHPSPQKSGIVKGVSLGSLLLAAIYFFGADTVAMAADIYHKLIGS